MSISRSSDSFCWESPLSILSCFTNSDIIFMLFCIYPLIKLIFSVSHFMPYSSYRSFKASLIYLKSSYIAACLFSERKRILSSICVIFSKSPLSVSISSASKVIANASLYLSFFIKLSPIIQATLP